jgi:4-hydroxy-4-methyl-2-oxoglutarate aldolase
VIPMPGAKEKLGELNVPVRCGGVEVGPGDIVVGDEEGVVVVPQVRAAEVLEAAQKKAAKDAAQTLEQWEANHRKRIDEALQELGFKE